MNVWSLCLVVLLVLLVVGGEGSKFKQNYPDYKSYQYQRGQSKASKWKDKYQSEPITGEPCTIHDTSTHTIPDPSFVHLDHQHPNISPQPPLPSQVGYLEYIVSILVVAVLVYVQIRRFNTTHVLPKKRVEFEDKKPNLPPLSEEIKEEQQEGDKEGELGEKENSEQVDQSDKDREERLEEENNKTEEGVNKESTIEEPEIEEPKLKIKPKPKPDIKPEIEPKIAEKEIQPEIEENEGGETSITTTEQPDKVETKEVQEPKIDPDEDWIVVNKDGSVGDSSSKSDAGN